MEVPTTLSLLKQQRLPTTTTKARPSTSTARTTPFSRPSNQTLSSSSNFTPQRPLPQLPRASTTTPSGRRPPGTWNTTTK